MVIVFLRGVNVGRHKRFLPAKLARELAAYDVVNIGAAGTFVVRAQVAAGTLVADIRGRLAFDADILVVTGRHLVEFVAGVPFGRRGPADDEQRFLSVMLAPPRVVPSLPVIVPAAGGSQVTIVAISGSLIAGVWKRGPGRPVYPSAVIERQFGVTTTRNWNTVEAICRTIGDL